MISRRRTAVSILAVFGLGSLSVFVSACSDVEVKPIVQGPSTSVTSGGAPLSQGGPMDVLFVVDDSSSMSDKQQYLSEMAGSFLTHLANPSCLDASKNVIGVSNAGTCTTGTPEFVAVTDIHVGIVSTSLGVGKPMDSSDIPCADDRGHLMLGSALGKQPTLDATTGVFDWNNQLGENVSQLVQDVGASVATMGENGCGLESQLESWYRFLVQPDPYDHLEWTDSSNNAVQLAGIDNTLLAQRKAFLRPNSTVAVVMLTDENDSSLDPLAVAGTAYHFFEPSFTPPPPTAACATDPTSSACTSCAFAQSDPSCNIDRTSDVADPNVAMFHVKQRFGIDPQFPITRYSSGLSSPRVPDRTGEHPVVPLLGAPGYVGLQDCDNPLFAAALPSDSSGDVCNLPRGPRNANQIFFTVIAGVPHELLQQDPTEPTSPFKGTLSEADYRTILGDDPIAYRFDGVDPHMLESLTPRSEISKGDPIVLGDWDTKGLELERACTFELPQPLAEAAFAGECTVDPSDPENDAAGDPVCAADGSQTQLYATATPAVRELSVARSLGYQAVVASICPVHVQVDAAGSTATTITNSKNDPFFGYEPAANSLISRMAGN